VDVALSRDKRVASGNDRLAERRPDLYGPLLAPRQGPACPP
jgi:hypothetical protein